MIWYILSVFGFSFPVSILLMAIASLGKTKNALYVWTLITLTLTIYAVGAGVLGVYTGVLCAS